MKIDSIKTTENRFIKKVKQAFSNRFSRLKALAKDVFERTPDESKYFVLNGKKIRDKGFLGGPRELPNSVTGPSDLKGITIKKVVLSDKDMQIMSKMSYEEKIAYRSKLLDEGKYRIEDY